MVRSAVVESSVLQAISSPRRREILRLVWDVERSSSEIAGHFPVSWPSVSRSLRALREAGVVLERRERTQRFYRADREALRPLEAFLTQLWDTGLDRLGRVLEQEPAQTPRRRR